MGITKYEKSLLELSEYERNKQLNVIKQYFLIDLLSDKEIAEKMNLSKTAIINVRNKYHIIRDTSTKLLAKCKREWDLYLSNSLHVLSLETFKTYESKINSEQYVSVLNKYVHEDLLSDEEIATELKLHVRVVKYLKNKYNIKRTKTEIYNKQSKTCANFSDEQKIVNKRNRQQAQLNRSDEDKIKSKQKREQTCLNKYGVKHNWQKPEIKEKVKQNSLEKYGTTNPMNGLKAKQTKLERYGNENYNNRKKYKETWNNKSNDEKQHIREKTQATCIIRYGGPSPFSSENVKNKFKNNFKTKYGYDSPFKTPEIQEKIKNTNMQKYGVPWNCMTEQCKNSQGGIISQVNKRFAKLLEINNIKFEQEYALENKLYDFKVGNVLIEINPTYTHNSTIAPYFSKNAIPTPKDYHLNKSLVAQKHGFRCIHVFDWDNVNKIINLLLPKEIIYARDCEIRVVDKKEVNTFLNLYHLQDTCKGQNYCYGLYYNNILVELMTFGKPRYNKNYEYELLRLCSHKNYRVVGGSQRLFKHFLKELNPKSIISYCDNSKFSGEVYEKLGMVLSNQSGPACIWSKGSTKITDNLLRQQGFDRLFSTNYGKGTSNVELILNEGFVEVYDCGQKIFEYINNTI